MSLRIVGATKQGPKPVLAHLLTKEGTGRPNELLGMVCTAALRDELMFLVSSCVNRNNLITPFTAVSK